jgi:hypothetical protein
LLGTDFNLNLVVVFFVIIGIVVLVVRSGRPVRSLSEEERVVPGVVLEAYVRAGVDERLDAVEVCVERGPVQGRVAGVVAVVNERG